MEEKSKTLSDEKIFTVANILTFCRIVLIAPFLYFFITERYIEATATVVASGLSDCFDGLLARKLNQVSDLGKLLDPVADKLTLVAVAVCICIMFPIVIPLMVILALKDLLMLCGGLYMIKKGIKPPAAKWYGKVGTIVFYFSVCLIVFLKAFFQIESDILAIVMMSLTEITMIFALVKYFQLFLKLRKENI